MKYQKKPIVIEAVQLPFEKAPDWLAEAMKNGTVWGDGNSGLRMRMLEGVMHASRGDWIIKGVENEIYPCKPSIFEATYEPAK